MTQSDLASQGAVLSAVIMERDYQDRIWERPEHDHTILEFACFIRRYLNAILDSPAGFKEEQENLSNMRKIAALAIACMEQNGVVERKL